VSANIRKRQSKLTLTKLSLRSNNPVDAIASKFNLSVADTKKQLRQNTADLLIYAENRLFNPTLYMNGCSITQEDMENAGINNYEGVNFSVPRKSEMAGLRKQRMMSQQLFFPHLTWEKPYRSDLFSGLNVERFELRKDGAVGLSHPNGTHDDVFWACSLGVYATVDMKPSDIESLKFG